MTITILRSNVPPQLFAVSGKPSAQRAWLAAHKLFDGQVEMMDQRVYTRPLVRVQEGDASLLYDAVTGSVYEAGGRCRSTTQLSLKRVTPDKDGHVAKLLLGMRVRPSTSEWS